MNNINFLVWLVPIIFMIHDFEEIIMAEAWGNRYKPEIEKTFHEGKPFGLNNMQDSVTPAFSIGVGVIFLTFSLISFFSILFQNYFFWWGGFLGLVIHMLLIHILICFRFKHYIPGVVTASIFLLPGIWILVQAEVALRYDLGTMLWSSLFGLVLNLSFLLILHPLMGPWSRWLAHYAGKGIQATDQNAP